MVFPVKGDLLSTRTRHKFWNNWYSPASSFSDLFFLPLRSLSPFLVRKILLNGISITNPTATQTSPTGVNEKKVRGAYPAEVSASWITRFGGVPISVIIPPILLANASGISRRLTLICVPIAILTTIGSIKATVPVLLTKAPMKAVTSTIRIKSFNSLSPANFRIRLLIIFAKPVWKMAPPTTNNPIIMITTELEKPVNASSGVRIPNIISNTKAQSATKSERTLPLIKNIAERNKTMRVIYI